MSSSPGVGGSGAGDFVGRAWELAEIEAALAAAINGAGQFVLVTGEPGIGKTRLVREALGGALRRRCTSVWANCWEGDDAPPYWPWVQVARALVEGTITDLAPFDRRALATLLPETDGDPLEADDRGSARVRLIAVVDRLVRTAAADRPLALVLDDLQWADGPSLELLSHLVGHLPSHPIALIGTCRDGEAAPRLSAVGRHGRTLRLEGLATSDLAALVKGALQEDAPPTWLERLRERTGGNPFFAREVARLAAAQRDPAAALGPPPRSVVDVIERRVARLPQAVADVLNTAAVIGGEFSPITIATAGTGEAAVHEAVDVAVRAGLLTAAPSGFRFAHALVREALLESIGPVRRAATHARLAVALESEPGTPPEVLARHFLGAVPVTGAERAVRYAIAAGERALAAAAHEDAVPWFDRAVALCDDPDPRSLRARLGRAEARRWIGDWSGARDDLTLVVAACRTEAEPPMVAEAALAVHRLGFMSGQLHAEPVELLERAAAVLEEGDVPLRARVLAALAIELWDHAWDRLDEARAVSIAALELAERSGSDLVIARCLEARYTVEWRPGGAGVRAKIAREMGALARRAGDDGLLATALLLEATALVELADPAAFALVEQYFDVASRVPLPAIEYEVTTRRACMDLLRGDLERAEGLIDRARPLAERVGLADAPLVDLDLRLELLRFSRRRGTLLDRPPIPVRTSAVSLLGLVERPLMLLDAGRIDEARACLDQLRRVPLDRLKRDWIYLHNVTELAEVAIGVGDHDLAAECYAALFPYAGETCLVSALVSFGGAVDHHLGALALALGDREGAVRHLQAALAMHERLGARLWAQATRTLVQEAASGRARGQLCRQGKVWRVVWLGAEAHLPDSKGMRDIAALLETPNRDVPATELYGVVGGNDRGGATTDERARAAYRRRLAEIEHDLDSARLRNDPVRAERMSLEREALIAELRRNFDNRGRPRRLGDMAERARKAVTARVRDAVGSVAAAHPDLGQHLRESIRTGAFCSYRPEFPVEWDVARSDLAGAGAEVAPSRSERGKS